MVSTLGSETDFNGAHLPLEYSAGDTVSGLAAKLPAPVMDWREA